MKFRTDYYEILEVPASVGFLELKRAYYRRAKDCHPDRFGGAKAKEEEFKILVEAFDVLSDPVRRQEYDRTLPFVRSSDGRAAAAFHAEDPRSVMDSLSDDILEELIVGNPIPPGATLQTLMRDLESTERFCLFREAKTLYHAGRLREARPLFDRVAGWSPENILYRYYLAKTLARLGRSRKALRHLRAALAIGAKRLPPQQLLRVRRTLYSMQKERRGVLERVLPFSRPPACEGLSSEEATTRQVGRLIDRMSRDQGKTGTDGGDARRLLGN